MILKKLLTSTAMILATALIASCSSGGSSDSNTTVGVVPPPTGPTVTFSPAALTVGSEGTGNVTATSSDGAAPVVSCTNGGSLTNGVFTAPRTGLNVTSVCTATVNGAAASGSLSVTVNQAPANGDVTVSGKITFDLVPFNTSTNGLNYAAISRAPARGITLEAVNANGTVIQTQSTDENGDYEFILTPNTEMRVRARAEMIQTSGAQWNVQVVDNTSSAALYSITGSLLNVGTLDTARNLNAGSGWGGSSYTGTRSAAPFAILNPIYESLQKVAAVDPDVIFPDTVFNWSTENRPVLGNIAEGDIFTSSYIGGGEILILGDENSDTDEYDDHVIVHEWGHYFEDQLSRSDSVGGSHSGGQELDPRLAMGEGFGNALSGIMLDDPFYRDSFNTQQAEGFSINVEANDSSGWYDEFTVQSVLYDIYDTPADGTDTLALGLGPIYETFTSPGYINQSTFTSIFSFLAELRTQAPSSATVIDTFAAERGINSTAADGAGETNSGSIATALPVYKQVTVNGPAVRICSVVNRSIRGVDGLFNQLGNREYLRFAATAGTHTLTMTRVSGATSRNPDFVVYQNGGRVGLAESRSTNSESVSIALTAGEHVIEAYDFNNLGRGGGTAADACYNFSITR